MHIWHHEQCDRPFLPFNAGKGAKVTKKVLLVAVISKQR